MVFCWGDTVEGDPVVLIVGLGAASLALCRKLPEGAEVVVVEPKDFVEFTPGILRGFCDIDHWRSLVISVSDVLEAACPTATWIKGRVETMQENLAVVSSEAGAKSEVRFDYAVIATGSSNGIWKPDFDCSMDLATRETQLQAEQARLRLAEEAALSGNDNFGLPRIAVSGAGIVGVELVAEIVECFPGLRSHVVLLSRNDRILPNVCESAANYCANWLEQNGVKVCCGVACREYQAWLESERKDRVISYLCVGGQAALPHFEPSVAVDARGHVMVNSAMQILATTGDAEALWANGRVFAFGDCAEVLGLEGLFPKTIYPAEGNAGILAHNLLMSLQGRSDEHKEVSPMLSPVIISLGSRDAVMDVSQRCVLSGRLASIVKGIIERSKLGQASGDFWGSLLWRFVPHI